MASVQSSRLLPGEGATMREAEEATTDRLLPGEDPKHELAEDVEHWIAVYGELLEFKRFMLDGATARAAKMATEEARTEVADTDIMVAKVEAERFARRLAYWRGRGEALKRTSGG